MVCWELGFIQFIYFAHPSFSQPPRLLRIQAVPGVLLLPELLPLLQEGERLPGHQVPGRPRAATAARAKLLLLSDLGRDIL